MKTIKDYEESKLLQCQKEIEESSADKLKQALQLLPGVIKTKTGVKNISMQLLIDECLNRGLEKLVKDIQEFSRRTAIGFEREPGLDLNFTPESKKNGG